MAAYNSSALLGPRGDKQFVYDKIHLVPFSEYVPWHGLLWFVKDLTEVVGNFGRGSRYSVGHLPGGRFNVLICYEAVFPDEVRRFVNGGSELLINISNDGWFGRSSARAQHLAMARVRAAAGVQGKRVDGEAVGSGHGSEVLRWKAPKRRRKRVSAGALRRDVGDEQARCTRAADE